MLIILVTLSPKSSAFVFLIVDIKSSFIIAFLISAHSTFSTTFFFATFKYIIAVNFKAVRVFSVSFFKAFNAATDFGLIFPMAFFAASILGNTVLSSYSTFEALSFICFFIASISTDFFSAFSLLSLAFSVSFIIWSNFSFVSFCFLVNSTFLIFRLSFNSFTVVSVSMIF